ncbi:unnamed protein product [Acanthosepion pharaonis]|uniref:Chloride channel CLIC-like protein 1 n=1 Tax=Acanthosepion pharaonis TaxID=158019 RepID=A0A812C3P5_ACAPH|nr:unnamed protein product [Sepia pharaonis]
MLHQTKKKMQVTYCLLFMALLLPEIQVAAKLWDMETSEYQETNVPKKEAVKEKADSNEQVTTESQPASCSKHSNYEATTLKQFIGKFLNQFQPLMVPGSNEEKIEYNMKMKLSALDLKKLSLYMDKLCDIYEVEEILTSMLGDVSSDEMLLSNLPMSFYEKYFSYILLVAPIIFIIVLVLSLKFMYLSYWMLTKWIVFQSVLISIFWNWYFLYQENVTKYMTAIENGPPKECNSSHTSGFFESLKSSITNIFHFPENECEQYYLITSISPALRVPPTEAFSYCIVNTILKPMASIGEHVGLFFQKLSHTIPFHLQIVAVISLLVILLFVILICNGYSIGTLFLTLNPPPPPPTTTTTSPEFTDLKEVHKQLKKIMEHLEKTPSVDDLKDIHELSLKSIKNHIDNRKVLYSIANTDGSGDQAKN